MGEPLGYRRLEYTTNCKYALSGSGCLDSLNVCHLNGPFPCSNGSNQKMMDLCAPIKERNVFLGDFHFYAAAWLLEEGYPADFGREQFPLDKKRKACSLLSKIDPRHGRNGDVTRCGARGGRWSVWYLGSCTKPQIMERKTSPATSWQQVISCNKSLQDLT